MKKGIFGFAMLGMAMSAFVPNAEAQSQGGWTTQRERYVGPFPQSTPRGDQWQHSNSARKLDRGRFWGDKQQGRLRRER